nr:NAD-dependent 4,6-dehydratase LegB [Salidesulfovibrio onnuriiensis]
MKLTNKKILVTGADGFIGSHLAEQLVRLGANVRAFVMYNSFNSWGWLDHSEKAIRNNLEVFAGDIRDQGGVRQAMAGCDLVFHLAALISIPFSYHSPGAYVDTNVKGTLNIIQAAQDLGLERVVHTSTSEVYGTALYAPIDESHPLQAQSPYSASKMGGDHIAISFHRSFGTPVSIVRPFNTYGPRQSARAVIPTIITQALNGTEAIKLGALHPTRDFNFVEDTVAGFLAVAESNQTLGEIVNIGGSAEISIGDLAQTIFELTGSKAEILSDQQRIRPKNSEVERLWGDNTKAKKLTTWKPQHTGTDGLKKGLQKTIDWFSKPGHMDLYKSEIYNV